MFWEFEDQNIDFSNNSKTISTVRSYVSCKERRKVLVNSVNSKRTPTPQEKQEYTWKIRIDDYSYLGLGFAESEHEFNWDEEISLQGKCVICCNEIHFVFKIFFLVLVF